MLQRRDPALRGADIQLIQVLGVALGQCIGERCCVTARSSMDLYLENLSAECRDRRDLLECCRSDWGGHPGPCGGQDGRASCDHLVRMNIASWRARR